MKKSISITLNRMVFNIEEDAYERLSAYLESLKRHFGQQDYGKEVVNDIESRISEQFDTVLKNRKAEAISLPQVEEIIKTMGSVADLAGDTKRLETETPVHAKKRLYRNPDDQIIAGVAGGIASYFNIDPILPRSAFVLFALAGGYGILLYIILWIIVPEAQTSAEKLEMKGNAVTLANLEESRKEKKDVKNFNVIRYFFREILYLAGRFFKALGPMVLTIMGLLATAVAFVGIFAISLMTVILIFNPNAPYIDPTINQIFTDGKYAMMVISGYVALIIPALAALLIGISFVRKKNVFNTAVAVTFVILWLAGALTFGAMASTAAPQIQATVQSLESQPDSSREFQVSDFDSIRAEVDQIIRIKYGTEPKVVAFGREEDLRDMDTNVRNRTLFFNQQEQGFRICLICYHRPISVEITTPDLKTVDALHSSEVEISGFENLDQLRLEIRGAAELNFTGSAETILADIEHAAKATLIGRGINLRAETSNASSLDAGGYITENVEVNSRNSSSAEVYATKRIEARATGASRINYAGNPKDEKMETENAGRVTEIN